MGKERRVGYTRIGRMAIPALNLEIGASHKGAQDGIKSVGMSIRKLNANVKKQSADNVKAIGGIQKGFTSLAGTSGSVSSQIGGDAGKMAVGFRAVSLALKGVAASARLAGQGIRAALISSGVGAVIVLLGAAVGAVVAHFSRFQSGLDAIKPIMLTIENVAGTLIDRIALLGGALVKFIKGDFQGAVADIKAATAKIDLEEIYDQSSAVGKTQIAIRKLKLEETIRGAEEKANIARIRHEIELLRSDREKANLTTEQELALTDQIIAKQNDIKAIYDAQFKRREEGVKLQEQLRDAEEAADNLRTDEDKQKYADAYAASLDLRTQGETKVRSIQTEQTAELRKQVALQETLVGNTEAIAEAPLQADPQKQTAGTEFYANIIADGFQRAGEVITTSAKESEKKVKEAGDSYSATLSAQIGQKLKVRL